MENPLDDSPWKDLRDLSDDEEPAVRPTKKKTKKSSAENRLSLAAFMENEKIDHSGGIHGLVSSTGSSSFTLFSNDLLYPGYLADEQGLKNVNEPEAEVSLTILEDAFLPSRAPELDLSFSTVGGSTSFSEESQLEVIKNVIPGRNLEKKTMNSPVQNLMERFDQPRGLLRVFRKMPRGPHMPVVSSDKQFYVRLKPKNWRKNEEKEFSSANVVGMTSLDSAHKFRSLLDAVRTEMDLDLKLPLRQTLPALAGTNLELQNMWVDKYRPDRYTDLLSDEGVNRALLHWLKLWDGPVFRRDPTFLSPYQDFGKRKNRQQKNVFDKGKYGGVSDFCFLLDADKRPRFKAALLSGPPGLGKTTLAHIIARHAGYQPMEINASDDRQLEVFRNRVETSLVNGNVATLLLQGSAKSNRPKCLIIDEIDGAPSNTVEYLVRLLKGEAKTSAGKKKLKKVGVWRPVICICNDLYASALKPLRQCTMILRFPPINRDRLTTRLSDICRKMAVQADPAALYSLCEKSDDDIRTCLNSLQFASVQGKRLNIQDVSKAAVGCKDQRKQLLTIWGEIFRLPKNLTGSDPRTGPTQNKNGTIPRSGTETDRIGRILEMVQLGDTDKIISGVFENYLMVHHKDSSLQTASQCADWRVYSDVMERAVYQDQNWFLLGYLNFYPVAVHVFLAALSTPLFSFPSAQYESQKKNVRNQEITADFLKDLPPTLYRTTKSMNLSTEFIPFLTHIIQPQLKAMSMHLLSNSERLDLKRVIDLMISFGLSYQEDRSLTGIHTELLDPQLEAISCWPGVQQCATMPVAVRAMVSREVQLRRISVSARTEADAESLDDMETDVPATTPVLLKRNPLASTVPTTSQNTAKLQVWSVYDYVRQQNPSQVPKPVAVQLSTRKVWFRYKEGFSNAVCRDIKIKDLIFGAT